MGKTNAEGKKFTEKERKMMWNIAQKKLIGTDARRAGGVSKSSARYKTRERVRKFRKLQKDSVDASSFPNVRSA